MTKTRLCAAIVVLAAHCAFPQASLTSAARQAKQAARAAGLAIELRHMSEALKPQGDEDDLGALSKQGRAALTKLRAEQFSGQAVSVLDKLDGLYAELPKKTWAKDYAADLVAIVALTPSWAADRGGTERHMLERLERALVLPSDGPNAVGAFPEDVPLEEFKKLDPIQVFLIKHRLARPAQTAQTTANDLVAGRFHVQVGAQVEGVVNWATNGSEFDRDYCFNIGNLHLEITPEWVQMHPGFIKPKVGQRVRASGWTYYDVFHKAEHEYDPNDPVMGAQRYTLWEIHPVQELTLLP